MAVPTRKSSKQDILSYLTKAGLQTDVARDLMKCPSGKELTKNDGLTLVKAINFPMDGVNLLTSSWEQVTRFWHSEFREALPSDEGPDARSRLFPGWIHLALRSQGAGSGGVGAEAHQSSGEDEPHDTGAGTLGGADPPGLPPLPPPFSGALPPASAAGAPPPRTPAPSPFEVEMARIASLEELKRMEHSASLQDEDTFAGSAAAEGTKLMSDEAFCGAESARTESAMEAIRLKRVKEGELLAAAHLRLQVLDAQIAESKIRKQESVHLIERHRQGQASVASRLREVHAQERDLSTDHSASLVDAHGSKKTKHDEVLRDAGSLLSAALVGGRLLILPSPPSNIPVHPPRDPLRQRSPDRRDLHRQRSPDRRDGLRQRSPDRRELPLHRSPDRREYNRQRSRSPERREREVSRQFSQERGSRRDPPPRDSSRGLISLACIPPPLPFTLPTSSLCGCWM